MNTWADRAAGDSAVTPRLRRWVDIAAKALALVFVAVAIASGCFGEYARGTYDLMIARLLIWLTEH